MEKKRDRRQIDSNTVDSHFDSDNIQSMATGLGEKDITVLTFLYEWTRPIRVGDIKNRTNMPHSTLNSVIKRLMKKELVKWDRYGLVELLPAGKKIAAHELKHHVILENFFMKFLGMPKEQAHVDAMQTAGCLSCEAIERMKAMVEDEEKAPCGTKIKIDETIETRA